jgi:hypothetical protein
LSESLGEITGHKSMERNRKISPIIRDREKEREREREREREVYMRLINIP